MQLTLQGCYETLTLEVRHESGPYSRTVHIKQTEFGIQPIGRGRPGDAQNELDIRFQVYCLE
jgi:hypothetical protein